MMFRKLSFSFSLLSVRDKYRLSGIVLLQVFAAFVDMVAVSSVGLFTLTIIAGFTSDKTLWLLKLGNSFGIDESTIPFALVVTAIVLFTFRTIFSIYILKKGLYFLGKKSAAIAGDIISSILALPTKTIESIPSQKILYASTIGSNSLILGMIGTVIGLTSDLAIALALGFLFLFSSPQVALVALILGGGFVYALNSKTSSKSSHLGSVMAQTDIETREIVQTALSSHREAFTKGTLGFFSSKFDQVKHASSFASAEATLI